MRVPKQIIQRINYYWRLLGSALCFVLFGLLAIIVWSLLFPLLSVSISQRQQRILVAHRVAHYCFGFFVEVMRRLGVLSYEIQGAEILQQPGRLIVANHPSLIDIVLLISRVPNASCIVRGSLLNNPFMRSAIRHGEYVINEDPESLIEDCVAVLQDNISLIIFPQGTRSGLHTPVKFQRGAARIALQADVNITTVIILCDPPHLQKGERWYNIPLVRPHYRIIVGDEIRPAECVDSAMPSLASRQLTRFLERYFVEQQRIYSQS